MRKTLKERFDEKWVEDKDTGCWVWTASIFKQTIGYGRIQANNSSALAHRVSYELYKEEIPKGLFVCHKCDNPLCVNPDHLFVGTAQDNMTDMVIKKRSQFGTKNNKNKLSEKQVMDIFNDNDTCKKIAKKYNISDVAVSKIKTGKRWGWLTGKKFDKIKRKYFKDVEEIKQILNKRKNGVSVKTLSEQYNASDSCIRSLLKKYE